MGKSGIPFDFHHKYSTPFSLNSFANSFFFLYSENPQQPLCLVWMTLLNYSTLENIVIDKVNILYVDFTPLVLVVRFWWIYRIKMMFASNMLWRAPGLMWKNIEFSEYNDFLFFLQKSYVFIISVMRVTLYKVTTHCYNLEVFF